MKHIKSKKIFESVGDDTILLEMEDRLRDLEDMGYQINVAGEVFGDIPEYSTKGCTGYIVYIGNPTKNGKGKKFSYDSIKEHLHHLEEFMKSNTRFVSSGYWMKIKRGDKKTMTSSLILQFVPRCRVYENRMGSHYRDAQWFMSSCNFVFHPKPIKESEEPIDDVVKDICIELEDMDYSVRYSEEPKIIGYRDNGGLSITITKTKIVEGGIHGATERKIPEPINVGEIRDTLERLKDYLDDRLVYIHCYIDNKEDTNDGWYDLENDFNTDDINGIMIIVIKTDR